jgi:serine protease Do
MPIGGDVVIAANGQPLTSFGDLVVYLTYSTQINDTVTLTVLRDGKEQNVQVTIATRPGN